MLFLFGLAPLSQPLPSFYLHIFYVFLHVCHIIHCVHATFGLTRFSRYRGGSMNLLNLRHKTINLEILSANFRENWVLLLSAIHVFPPQGCAYSREYLLPLLLAGLFANSNLTQNAIWEHPPVLVHVIGVRFRIWCAYVSCNLRNWNWINEGI